MMRVAMREKHDGNLGPSDSVRLWLRLLSCAMVIEKGVRRSLTEGFQTTLPRFDVLAALDRHPNGMTMGALSRSLLVSNGNVTALVRALERDGHVTLVSSATDRRANVAAMTGPGKAYFDTLAAAHHRWIDAMFDDLTLGQRERLFDLLGALKASIAHADPVQMP